MKLKNKIRTWLDIKDIKDWSTEFERLEKDTWKYQQVLKKRVNGTCPECNKIIHLWPLETEAYYTKEGKAYHIKCYSKNN